jgi:hypothetical protein
LPHQLGLLDAFFVERTFLILLGIGFPLACTRVTEKVDFHSSISPEMESEPYFSWM